MKISKLLSLFITANILSAQEIPNIYEIKFQTNTKTSTSYGVPYAYGGGINTQNILEIFQYQNVTLSNNSSTSIKNLKAGIDVGNALVANAYSYGGAIYSTNSIHINNNTHVDFSDNYAQASTSAKTIRGYRAEAFSYSAGGAIYSTANIDLLHNGAVTFRHNYVTASSYAAATGSTTASTVDFASSAHGGAIFTIGNLNISGNDIVLFEKNYEKIQEGNEAAVYLLRSIHLESADELTLSSKNAGNITIYDSLYMKHKNNAIVSLNTDYEDENGVTQNATGDIVFSGKYTEEHLKEIKGSDGTTTEIASSRTSELLNTINIYGGTLRVEDKATLKTHAINVVADGNATMKVLDAEVNASSYDVTINSTGQLTLGGTDGIAKLTAKNININQGATLSVERTEVPEPVPAITLAAEETVSIFNEKLGGVASGNLNLAAGSTYKADGAHLSVINGTLTFNATEGEKINLVLTLHAEYEKDSQVILFTDVNTVKFVLDNITATKTGQAITLNAADYFTGDWINEKTNLVYDSGTVYVTGVNRVVPEPSTATLSLLALAALAARRRRR
ncbi:MAG: PEP-CTERM sorting domain-containing protein [Akkermansia sp.]|nr:PEP-CTERM sorting domain-containing protein [Akkermansia sp.]